ncbi:hypothetical protein K438DRAFT_1617385, partial [Mycena galopus ATCC 62051]
RQYAKRKEFRKFRRPLFHSSIERILQLLKPYMTKPRITRCSDSHFRYAIYGLGPYIADYPEQTLLTCIVQGCCPWYISTNTYAMLLLILPSYLSPAHGLDRDSPRRCAEHTNTLLEGCTLKEPWDDSGIIGDTPPHPSPS